eukprot:TRINITY_DN24523_c0_g1_i3.p1 TRINITY_DN24523_c0_g1~~TRINITY_DN24523_c0_g1_i3.p1  ORF type:complete len:242 (+),score=17.45 TRINITY_DN24523_c0_g1_i3:128-853(+)
MLRSLVGSEMCIRDRVTERLLEHMQSPNETQPMSLPMGAVKSVTSRGPPTPAASPVLKHDLAAMSERVRRLVAGRTRDINKSQSEALAAERSMEVNRKSINSMIAALTFLEGLSTPESASYFTTIPKTLLPVDMPNVLGNGSFNQCRAQQWVDYVDHEWMPSVASMAPSPSVRSFEQFVSVHRGPPTPSSPGPLTRSRSESVGEVSVVRKRLLKDMQFAVTQREVTGRSKQRLRQMKSKKF